MKYDPEKHHRRSIRLKGYDYSQAGAYFVTICTKNRECLFGDVIDDGMMLNEYGTIVANEWKKSAKIRDEIELDEWVVMPNHFHGIVVIRSDNERRAERGNVGMGGRGNVGDRKNVGPAGRPGRSDAAIVGGVDCRFQIRRNQTRQ